MNSTQFFTEPLNMRQRELLHLMTPEHTPPALSQLRSPRLTSDRHTMSTQLRPDEPLPTDAARVANAAATPAKLAMPIYSIYVIRRSGTDSHTTRYIPLPLAHARTPVSSSPRTVPSEFAPSYRTLMRILNPPIQYNRHHDFFAIHPPSSDAHRMCRRWNTCAIELHQIDRDFDRSWPVLTHMTNPRNIQSENIRNLSPAVFLHSAGAGSA